jgi:hypothetical protein
MVGSFSKDGSHRREKRRITTAKMLLQRVIPLLVSCFLFTTIILVWHLDSAPQQPFFVDILDNTPPAVQVQGQLQVQVQVQVQGAETSEKKNKWDDTDLPQWMKDYFVWHAKQVAKLTPDTWMKRPRRYLILRCYKEDKICGGASDRLKPIPLILLAAHKSKRIFFIRWERPCALEEFLVPPVGGINWTAPSWLPDKVIDNILNNITSARVLTSASRLIKNAHRPSKVLQTHLHDTHGGSYTYDAIEGENQFGKVYHDLFRIFFEASPGIKSRIQEKLGSAGLVPGEYAVAHYRAEYSSLRKLFTSRSFVQTTAINAINCASNLLPGKSIYFASDSLIAVKAVTKHARQFGRPVVTIEEEASPLHLEKERNVTDPSAFYSTFVDLFLMGNG